MDFTGRYRNNFISSTNYNYFSGKGLNLIRELFSGIPENSSSVENSPPDQYYKNEAKKRTSSCPLPMAKFRLEHPNSCPTVDEINDYTLFDFLNANSLQEETLHILVTGPPHCGKTRIIENLAKKSLHIKADGGPSLAASKSFSIYGRKVHTNFWYMKSPKECTKSLKDAFCGKNFAVIFVYDVTVPKTLFDVRDYILGFKRVFGVNVPMFLVGNKTDLRNLITSELSMLDWCLLNYSDGKKVKDDYKLVDFEECSGENGSGLDYLLLKVATATLGDYMKF